MPGFLAGQSRVERALTQALASNRLAHGLLFTGPAGVGRERAAFGIAAALLCEAGPQPNADGPWGCGTCRACRRARAGNHPDVHVLMSEAESVRRGHQTADKKKRPSGDILVEAVRELSTRLRMASYEGGARVAIVLDAHRMNTSAQNALLKTLEEPAPGTWIILIVPHERMMLPTIASRCLRLSFAPLAQEHIVSVLRARGVAAAEAEARAARAEGSLRRALEVDPAADAGPGSELLRVIFEGSARDRLDVAEALGKERQDVDAALADVERILAGQLRQSAAAAQDGAWQKLRAVLEAVHSARLAIAHNASVHLCLEALLLGPTQDARGGKP